jgi:GT2 family glycosyltransferase
VDNGSQDGSISRIKEYAEEKKIKISEYTLDEVENRKLKGLNDNLEYDSNYHFILIKSSENHGFAEGNNIGIRFALDYLDPDYILLLNNDTVVDVNFLDGMVKLAETDEKIGILGPKVYYYDKPDVINSAGVKMNWRLGIGKNIGIKEVDNGQFEDILELDSLIGACLLIKSSVFKKIGLMDGKFFLLLEETDFCFRARINDFKIIFFPKSKIYHKEGFSGKLNPASLYYRSRNRLFLIRKHQPVNKTIIYTILISIEAIMNSLIYGVKGEFESSKAIIKGHFDGLKY